MGPGPILLIWEEVPDATKLFLLDDLTQEQFDQVVAAHGTFVNLDNETEATVFVSDLLFDSESGEFRYPPIMDTSKGVDTGKPLKLDRPVTIVLSGFML